MLKPFDLAPNGKVIIRSGRKIYFFDVNQISYIEACSYYTLVHEGGRTHIIRQTLDEFEGILSGQPFVRIHRSVILNFNIFKCIERINSSLQVQTTIGKVFRISRYRNKTVKGMLKQISFAHAWNENSKMKQPSN